MRGRQLDGRSPTDATLRWHMWPLAAVAPEDPQAGPTGVAGLGGVRAPSSAAPQ